MKEGVGKAHGAREYQQEDCAGGRGGVAEGGRAGDFKWRGAG